MKRKVLNLFLVLCLSSSQFQFVDGSESIISTDSEGGEKYELTKDRWPWERILRSRETIVANGNVWPPTKNETAHDCLILVTRTQYMWHCPSGDDSSHERTVLYRNPGGRYRGAFMAPGTENRRLWLLNSPKGYDEIVELDTVTGEILQRLEIEGTEDGHDAVRVGDKVFIVDTRHGHVVEIAIPPSAPPYTESSIEAGAKFTEYEDYVDIIKRHTGFTRADHINNVAIHDKLLISNLHGKGAINIRAQIGSNQENAPSPTRVSALLKSIPEELGRELDPNRDGFHPVENVGTWCHGIAFWEDVIKTSTEKDEGEGGNAESRIKLISLDSKSGALVSVVLAGPNEGQREVLWVPDETHPVLVPPEGVARAYNNGAKIFSKGLAVQGGVAYFGVSYAREPKLRQTVPESLLVAVDLATKKELWVRIIRSNGLINQILTQSYLGGKIQLPHEISTIELTSHHVMVATCTDIKIGEEDEFCLGVYKKRGFCKSKAAKKACCKCKGGNSGETSLAAGKLDIEVSNLRENVTATATFVHHNHCLGNDGAAKRLPLELKERSVLRSIKSVNDDVDKIVKHLCNLDVGALTEKFVQLGDEGFTTEYQRKNGNAVMASLKSIEKFKPGVKSIMLVFSSKQADRVYHFPWLYQMLPMLEESVFGPLGIPLNQILRMQVANMPIGSDIRFHQDKNSWVHLAHRVHIPIITHSEVFFLAEIRGVSKEDSEIIRIKSNAGEVYEFNNALGHAVRNIGPSRVHLIIDWMETPSYNENSLTMLTKGMTCDHPKGSNELICDLPNLDVDEL